VTLAEDENEIKDDRKSKRKEQCLIVAAIVEYRLKE